MHEQEIISGIIKNANEAIIAIDLKGNIILWNKSAENLFGYKKKEVMGKFYPLVNNKASYELSTIISKSKEEINLDFKTQKQNNQGNKIDLIFHTNPLYNGKQVVGVAIIAQPMDIIKKVCYLSLEINQVPKEPKRTFSIIRNMILLTIGKEKKTINQISSEAGINWRTVEKHLTFLLGKKLVNEIFSSEYVRIFEMTQLGKDYAENIKDKGDKK